MPPLGAEYGPLDQTVCDGGEGGGGDGGGGDDEGGLGGGEGGGGGGGTSEFAHDAQVARQPTRSLLPELPYRPFSVRLLQLAVH